MTDIRRTLLWVVFTMSLLLLWDAWQKHTGQPSMFSPAPRTAANGAAAPGSAPGGGVPSPVASASPGAPPAAAAAPAATPTVTVSTDLLKVTLDSRGGDVIHAELLTQRDQADPNRHVVLFDRSAQRV